MSLSRWNENIRHNSTLYSYFQIDEQIWIYTQYDSPTLINFWVSDDIPRNHRAEEVKNLSHHTWVSAPMDNKQGFKKHAWASQAATRVQTLKAELFRVMISFRIRLFCIQTWWVRAKNHKKCSRDTERQGPSTHWQGWNLKTPLS
jgi:hypothetical protein